MDVVLLLENQFSACNVNGIISCASYDGMKYVYLVQPEISHMKLTHPITNTKPSFLCPNLNKWVF